MNMEAECPAPNCLHILTLIERDIIKKGIDQLKIIEKTTQEESLLGVCKICNHFIIGTSEYIELSKCKHKLHYLCINKLPKKIKKCPDQLCAANLNKEDFFLIEELRLCTKKICLFCGLSYANQQNSCIFFECKHTFHKKCFALKYKKSNWKITRCSECYQLLSKSDLEKIKGLGPKSILGSPKFPECVSKNDQDDLQILEFNNSKQIPIEEIKEINEDQSICKMCGKSATEEELKELECGHRFHVECTLNSIGEQTGQRMMLTPREQLNYKLKCPAQKCAFDISASFDLKEYITEEAYLYYESEYEKRKIKDEAFNKKAKEISGIYINLYKFIYIYIYIIYNIVYILIAEGEKYKLGCCQRIIDKDLLTYHLLEYGSFILGTKG